MQKQRKAQAAEQVTQADPACDVCGLQSAAVFACPACEMAHYCSEAHQRDAWFVLVGGENARSHEKSTGEGTRRPVGKLSKSRPNNNKLTVNQLIRSLRFRRPVQRAQANQPTAAAFAGPAQMRC